MSAITHKRVIVIYLVLIGLGMLFLLIRVVGGSNTSESQTTRTTVGDNTKETATSVSLTNSQNLPRSISTDTATKVKSQLYTAVRRNTGSAKPSFSGIIRANSISEETPSNGGHVTTFLVDFPETKQTYRVRINGDESSEFHGIYVLCPSARDLKYGAFTCTDG